MKRKKKWNTCLLAILLLLGTLTACGGAANSAATGSAPGAATEKWDVEADGGIFYDGMDMATSNMLAPESTASGGTETPITGEKLIYTAYLDVETTAFDSAHQAIDQIAASLDGYFENRSTNNHGSYRYANYTIRIPVEHYNAFLDQVSQFCHVRSTNEDIQNVSEIYYDIEARLTTQRTKLERLQELLAKAENMAEIITIESAISETELQIEHLTGSLRGYDNRIQYATFHVSLSEVYKLSNVEEPPVTFGQRLVSAFSGGCRSFVNFLENAAIFLAGAWIPLLLLAAAAIVTTLTLRKLRRRGRPAPFDPDK